MNTFVCLWRNQFLLTCHAVTSAVDSGPCQQGGLFHAYQSLSSEWESEGVRTNIRAVTQRGRRDNNTMIGEEEEEEEVHLQAAALLTALQVQLRWTA